MKRLVKAIRLAKFLRRYSGHTVFQAIKKAFYLEVLIYKTTCKSCGQIITVSYGEYPECIDCVDDRIYTAQSEIFDDLDIDFDDDILQNVDIRHNDCKACMEIDCSVCPTIGNDHIDYDWVCDGICAGCKAFGTHVCETYNEKEV